MRLTVRPAKRRLCRQLTAAGVRVSVSVAVRLGKLVVLVRKHKVWEIIGRLDGRQLSLWAVRPGDFRDIRQLTARI